MLLLWDFIPEHPISNGLKSPSGFCLAQLSLHKSRACQSLSKLGAHEPPEMSKTSQKWAQAGCFPGEPIFVPRPDGQNEDDGVVLYQLS